MDKDKEQKAQKEQPEQAEEKEPAAGEEIPEAEKAAPPAEEDKKSEKRKKSSGDKEKLQKLEAELKELKEQHSRVLAEYDNFRKRTQNEKAGIYNNAVSDTVQGLLPIADNIALALAQENASAEDMKKGVEMISAQIDAAFGKLGLVPMGEVGEAFDPKRHNAVAHIEDEALGENVIAAVYQKGYLLGDRVVRCAMVQVAN